MPGDKDSAELTLVLAKLGIAHPTGYPLYTLLGSAFVNALHFVGASWAQAANAFSALGGGVAVALLTLLMLLLQPLEMSRSAKAMAVAIPATLFAFNPAWTYETTLTEVYSWHVAWALGMITWFRCSLARMTADSGKPIYRTAAVWGLLCGIGVSHHATSIFLVVPLSATLLAALLNSRRLNINLILTALVAAILPLFSYSYIYYRAYQAPVVQWPYLESGMSGFLAHVTGAQYRGHLWNFAPSPAQAELLRTVIYPILAIGLAALAAVNIRSRQSVDRWFWRGITPAFLLHLVYNFSYGVSDPSSYFLVVTAVALLAISSQLGRMLHWLPSSPRYILAAALSASALAMAATGIHTSLKRKAVFIDYDKQLRTMWNAINVTQGIVLWPDDMWYRLKIYQLLDGHNSHLAVYSTPALVQGRARREFQEKHGFDPMARTRPFTSSGEIQPYLVASAGKDAAFYASIHRSIDEQTRIPIVLFDPSRPAVWLLR